MRIGSKTKHTAKHAARHAKRKSGHSEGGAAETAVAAVELPPATEGEGVGGQEMQEMTGPADGTDKEGRTG